jgi:hypothetical protein
MGVNEVKLVISTDNSGVITGIKQVGAEGEKAVKQVTSAFEQLGIKSTAELDSARAKISSAYDQIRASGTASADDLIRAEKAKNDAIKRLNDENYVSQQSMGAKIKAHWLSISAAAIAAYGAISKAKEYMAQAAEGQSIGSAYKNVANSYGYDADAMLSKLKQLSKGTIEETDIMRRAIRGLQQGFSDADLGSLMEIAGKQASAAGMQIKDAFDLITNAVANQQTRGLKHLGIVIDQTKAYEEYAKKLDIGVNAMTEMQQSQALLNSVKEEGARLSKALGEIEDEEFIKIQRKAAAIKEFQEEFGGFLQKIRDLAVAGAYAVGSFINEIVMKVVALPAALEEMTGGAITGRFFRDIRDNAAAAVVEWDKRARTAWEGVTADTNKASAALDKHKEKLKGLAKAAADKENQRINDERTKKAWQKWSSEIAGMDPDMTEYQKQLEQLKTKKTEMIKDLGQTKAETLYQLGIENIAAAQDKAFDELLISGMYGIKKEMAELEKWYDENYRKFGDNEERKRELYELYAKKRFDITAKFGKEELEKQKEQLTKQKEYWQEIYDTAIEKAQDLAAQSKEMDAGIKDAEAFLTKWNNKTMTTQEQKTYDYKVLQERIRVEGFNYSDASQTLALMKDIQSYMEKYKSTMSSWDFGSSSDTWETGQMKTALEALIGKVRGMKTETDQQQSAWEAWGLVAKTNLDIINDSLLQVQNKIEGIDRILRETHELKLSTADAEQKLAALGVTLSNLLLQKNALGGSYGATGISSNTDASGNTVYTNSGQPYAEWAATNNFGNDIGGAADGAYIRKPRIIAIAEKEPEFALPESKLNAIVQAAVASGGSAAPSALTVNFGGPTINGSNKDGKALAREYDAEMAAMIRDNRSLALVQLKKILRKK